MPVDDWTPRHEQIVKDLLREWLTRTDNEPVIRQTAMEFDALPIFLDMWSCWFLGSDGRVIVRDVELGSGATAVYTDFLKRASALTSGVRRYPRLQSLLPLRPHEAIDCECGGHPLFDKVICENCGGLRWRLPSP